MSLLKDGVVLVCGLLFVFVGILCGVCFGVVRDVTSERMVILIMYECSDCYLGLRVLW